MVLFPIVFNRNAREVGNLILFPEEIGREEYVHRFDRRGRSSRPGGLVGHESIIDENPPEGLLSDITSERLIDYFRNNQRRNSVPLFDLGDNRSIAVRYFEYDKEQAAERLRQTSMSSVHIQ